MAEHKKTVRVHFGGGTWASWVLGLPLYLALLGSTFTYLVNHLDFPDAAYI